jgi:hypothetical protein
MARSGKKTILLDILDPEDIEYFTDLAKKKGKGVRISFYYRMNKGLELTLIGPQDRIAAVERLLLDAWRSKDNP